MKPLNESCYVNPEKNPRVLQESTPTRSNAIKMALQRHEDDIKKQKDFNEKIINNHYNRIKNDNDIFSKNVEDRRAKQKEFNHNIKQQMGENVSDFHEKLDVSSFDFCNCQGSGKHLLYVELLCVNRRLLETRIAQRRGNQ